MICYGSELVSVSFKYFRMSWRFYSFFHILGQKRSACCSVSHFSWFLVVSRLVEDKCKVSQEGGLLFSTVDPNIKVTFPPGVTEETRTVKLQVRKKPPTQPIQTNTDKHWLWIIQTSSKKKNCLCYKIENHLVQVTQFGSCEFKAIKLKKKQVLKYLFKSHVWLL